jgi:hypothetical protein
MKWVIMSRFSSSSALRRARKRASLLDVLVISFQQLDEQIDLAAEIGMKRAACIAGMGRDVLDAGALQTVTRDHHRARVQQPPARQIAAFLACQSFASHVRMLARSFDLLNT